MTEEVPIIQRIETSFQTPYRKSLYLAVLTVTFLALVLPMLGMSRVFQVSEGREGVVVRAMVAQDNLLLPLRQQEIVPSKPPLFHWLVLLLNGGRAELSEFNLRLPSAIAAALILLLLATFTLEHLGLIASIMTTATLASTYGFSHLASDGRVDMVFNFFVISALLVWFDAFLKAPADSSLSERRRSYRLVSILVGLGCLSKGPLAAVLVGIVIVPCLFIKGGTKGLKELFSWEWIWAIIIPLPWYIMATLSGGSSFVQKQLFFENWARVVGATGITQKPFYFYVPHFFLQGAPWSFVLLGLGIYGLYDKLVKKGTLLKQVSSALSCREKELLKYSLVWIISMFIFFTLASGKRRAYLITTLPALSIIASIYIRRATTALNINSWLSASPERKQLCTNIAIAVGSLPFILPLIMLMISYSGAYQLFSSSTTTLEFFEKVTVVLQRNALAVFISSFVLGTLSVGLLLDAVRKNSSAMMLASFYALCLYCSYVTSSTLLAMKAEPRTPYRLAHEIDIAAGGAPIYFIKTRVDESLDALFFYLNAESRLANPKTPPTESGLYIARANWVAEQSLEWLKGCKVLWRGKRAVDSEDEMLVMISRPQETDEEKTDNEITSLENTDHKNIDQGNTDQENTE